jgi:hypothetical protein
MMKKVLFILVLMMAAMTVNAQTKTTQPETVALKKGSRVALIKRGERIQLPGIIGQPIWYRIILQIEEQKASLKKGGRIASLASQGATKMPASDQKKGERNAITASDLPKPVTDNIATDFVGYTIKDATKVVKGKEVTYEVVVVKEAATETLVYGTE